MTQGTTPDVGLVLVHGIGEQREMETLTEAADALARWLDLATPSRTEGKPQPRGASIENGSTDEPSKRVPRHLFLHVNPEVAERFDLPQKWLLAEAWWAEAFPEPSKPQMLTWLIRVVPWVVLNHLSRLQDRMESTPGRGNLVSHTFWLGRLLVPIVYALALPLTLVLLIVFGLLYALSVVPIKGMDQIAINAQRVLSARLGDSYVFVSSAVREALIKQRVRAALEWVQEQQCRAIAFVAHSQGAAVVFEILRDILHEPAAKVASPYPMFLSYGSGIRKLGGIRALTNAGDASIGVWPVILFALTSFWFVLSARVSGGPWWAPTPIPWTLLTFVALFALSVVSYARRGKSVGAALTTLLAWSLLIAAAWLFSLPRLFILSFAAGYLLLAVSAAVGERAATTVPSDVNAYKEVADKIRWTDIYSESDPVPNGSLFAPEAAGSPFVERVVDNRRSWITDHTSYWTNLEQFVTWIVTEVSAFAQGRPHGEPSVWPEPTGGRWLQRGQRLDSLLTWRWCVIGTWLSLLASHPRAFPKSLLSGSELMDGTGPWSRAGLIAILSLVVYGLYLIVAAAWEIWNEMEVRVALLERVGTSTDSKLGVRGARRLAHATEWTLVLLFVAASAWAVVTQLPPARLQ